MLHCNCAVYIQHPINTTTNIYTSDMTFHPQLEYVSTTTTDLYFGRGGTYVRRNRSISSWLGGAYEIATVRRWDRMSVQTGRSQHSPPRTRGSYQNGTLEGQGSGCGIAAFNRLCRYRSKILGLPAAWAGGALQIG